MFAIVLLKSRPRSVRTKVLGIIPYKRLPGAVVTCSHSVRGAHVTLATLGAVWRIL